MEVLKAVRQVAEERQHENKKVIPKCIHKGTNNGLSFYSWIKGYSRRRIDTSQAYLTLRNVTKRG